MPSTRVPLVSAFNVKQAEILFIKFYALFGLISSIFSGNPIDVTKVWLMKEVQSAPEEASTTFPSPASGVEFHKDASLLDITWLVEPRRANLVKKWSGTNVHVSHSNNKMGSILTAFAHFVYQASNESYVLADIQSRFPALLSVVNTK